MRSMQPEPTMHAASRFATAALLTVTTSLFAGHAEAQGGSSSRVAVSASPSVGWTDFESRSDMTDEPTVVLQSRALATVHGWLETTWPTLTVRCREHVLSAYLVTGMASHVENADAEHTVRFRIDSTPAVTESNWRESTDDAALFSSDPANLVERLAAGREVLMEWTPFHARPVTARFQIADLDSFRHRLLAACPGAISDSSVASRAEVRRTPAGKAGAAVAALRSFIDDHPISGEGVRGGSWGARVTTHITGVSGCFLTVALKLDIGSIVSHDTAWVDLKRIRIPNAPKSSSASGSWWVPLETIDGSESIPYHQWLERGLKAHRYRAYGFNFSDEALATTATRLTADAISSCLAA